MCYSGIDDYPGVKLDDLDRSMPTLAARGIPLMVHAGRCLRGLVAILLTRNGIIELECSSTVTQASCIDGDPRRYSTFLRSRSDDMEISAIEAIIALAEKHDCQVHVVHLSSCKALPVLREARSRKLKLTVETCPHYLCFSAEEIGDGQTLFKCCPPIRDSGNRDQLWKGLLDGDIDMIVSDHSPSSPDVKCIDSGDFIQAWGGIAGLQFRLLSIWTESNKRGVTLDQLCKWLCENPAKLVTEAPVPFVLILISSFRLVWDPATRSTVSVVHHLHKCTPYESMAFSGRIHSTYRRGQLAYSSADESFGQPNGTLLRR